MRFFLSVTVALCIYAAGCSGPQSSAKTEPAAPPTAQLGPDGIPETIVYPASNGNVTFTHKKHYERLGGDCNACHPKIFPQSLAPLNYKKALHRVAEAAYSSCAHCHAVGATAFAADSNCTKCHVRVYPKS